MTQRLTLVTNFKDLSNDEAVREAVETRCQHLAAEFAEIVRIEVTLTADGVGFTAHGHVTGSHIDVATHADGDEAAAGRREAAREARAPAAARPRQADLREAPRGAAQVARSD